MTAPYSAPLDEAIAAVSAHRISAEHGSRALLAAQLRTGQYSEQQRKKWLARHGGDA
jgi:hypothetical protein